MCDIMSATFEKEEILMLKSLAEFSKTIKKYSYYPMLIGVIAIAGAVAYEGSRSTLAWMLAGVCAVLCLVALCSSKLCKMAGIDDKII